MQKVISNGDNTRKDVQKVSYGPINVMFDSPSTETLQN